MSPGHAHGPRPALQHWVGEHPRQDSVKPSARSKRCARASRFPDSGRVQTVLDPPLSTAAARRSTASDRAERFPPRRRPRRDPLDRLAVAPSPLRCTAGTLVIEGRGYGHGVGMSQVSAYQLAREGGQLPDILQRFYPLANVIQRWR